MDTELITAQEFEWVINNEPSFHNEGNSFVGKVGRTPSGRDIRIRIVLPDEFYPVIKPKVLVETNIDHPNIEPSGELALQLLEEWNPNYRIKDIIITARRLFLKSKNMIQEKPAEQPSPTSQSVQYSDLEQKIEQLQEEIKSYSLKINQIKAEKMDNAEIKNALGNTAIPISSKYELEATKKALQDLLGLIEYKFEDASMDEIVFFRLYRRYIREHYIVSKNLAREGGKSNVVSKQKTKEAIRN